MYTSLETIDRFDWSKIETNSSCSTWKVWRYFHLSFIPAVRADFKYSSIYPDYRCTCPIPFNLYSNLNRMVLLTSKFLWHARQQSINHIQKAITLYYSKSNNFISKMDELATINSVYLKEGLSIKWCIAFKWIIYPYHNGTNLKRRTATSCIPDRDFRETDRS